MTADRAGARSSSFATRSLAVDALRGLTVAAMILVNNPGNWGQVYRPLLHADWHGWTPTDLVFPTFLFVVGVSIPLAFAPKLAAGVSCATLRVKALRRGLVLVGLGLFLNAFPFITLAGGLQWDPDLARVRIPGVLQRIGVCYLMAALLYLHTSRRTRAWICVACLFGTWALLTWVPVPGFGPGQLDDKAGNLAAWVDRQLLGDHVWRHSKVYDPEGILSTLPALATTLLGIVAGSRLQAARDPTEGCATLAVFGGSLAVAGYAWSWVLPINKPLWTSSYAVLTAGLAASALGLLVWWSAVRGHRRVLGPLRTYGVNAITVFVGSGLVADVMALIRVGDRSLKGWIHRECLASWLPAQAASLAYALLWVVGWYAVLRVMERRNITLRV